MWRAVTLTRVNTAGFNPSYQHAWLQLHEGNSSVQLHAHAYTRFSSGLSEVSFTAAVKQKNPGCYILSTYTLICYLTS